jgi:hypothetical protein
VLLPAPHQLLEPEVPRVRRPQRPPRRPQVQLGQLLARQEVRDVARGDPHPALDDLHRASPFPPEPRGKPDSVALPDPHRDVGGFQRLVHDTGQVIADRVQTSPGLGP